MHVLSECILFTYIYIYIIYIYAHDLRIGGWGFSPTGKPFPIVRACTRWAVRWACTSNVMLVPFPFPFCPASLSYFPCEIMCLTFPFPPSPPTSYPTLVGVRGICIYSFVLYVV